METTTQDTSVMSVKDWALTIFLTGLPVIGIILLLVWAFNDSTNIHKQNWAKGTLLVFVIAIVLTLLFMIFVGGFAALAGAFQNN